MANNYREIAFVEYGEVCQVCGSDNDIQVHHIDGDRGNNDIDNLRPLCSDHHEDEHDTHGVGGSRKNLGSLQYTPEDLREVDWEIIALLRKGPSTVPELDEQIDYSRGYLRNRIVHLRSGGIATPVGDGIYELVPEEVPEDDD